MNAAAENANGLSGKTAVITGGGRGIGRSIAVEMAQAGARLFLLARTEEELRQTCDAIHEVGGKADYFVCDISDYQAVDMAFQEIFAQAPSIEILVNNAGVQWPIGPFRQNDLDEWKTAFAVNMFGTVHCSYAVLNSMISRGYGKIINLSGGGATSPRVNFSAYAAAKTAIVRFTETLAAEVKDRHIDVNAVSPGAINTRMLEEVLTAKEIAGAEYNEAEKRKIQGGNDPQLAARLICFLASPLSDGISGKLISAVWDPWQEKGFQESLRNDKDLATLRRIDNKGYYKKQ